MKISYITDYNALDIHKWSGLGYYIGRSLQNQNLSIQYINEQDDKFDLLLQTRKVLSKIVGEKWSKDRDFDFLKKKSMKTNSRIHPDVDVVFSPGTLPIALLPSSKPKVFYTDATFAGMVNFYEEFTGLTEETIRMANHIEQQALSSASLAIYSSYWAANTAIEHYDVDPAKIKVVPFGANISKHHTWQQVKDKVKSRSDGECKLLFVGVEWSRKGGSFALEVARLLNESGIQTTLHLVGIPNLPVSGVPAFVRNHGFVSKATIRGEQKLEELFSDSHFLMLPTKADCTPIVFSEANSFGLPVLTTDVGGISTVIKDDINGKTFPLSTNPEVWADYIAGLFEDRTRYNNLCFSAYNEFQTRLNWDTAGRTIMNYLKQL